MNKEHPLASELSHYLMHSRDGRSTEIPVQSMGRVMDSFRNKPYASDVRLDQGRAVFLLSPLELEEKGVMYSNNENILYKAENPATVTYNVWVAATKEGFKAVAKRSKINGEAKFSKPSEIFSQKLKELQYGDDPGEAKSMLAIFGVDSQTGNVRKFAKDLDSSQPLGMKGTIFGQYNVVDLSIVNQAIWKSREQSVRG